MHYKHCCVVDEQYFYKEYVLVQTENEEQTVVGYKMQDGDMLVDSETTPDRKQHAGGAGFVRPRWDEDAAAWVEGATVEEMAAWEAEHPAPAVNLDALRAAKQEQNKQALADWLAAHPLTWTDGKVYGVTEQDQTEMAINFAQYQLATAAGQPAVLEWHTQKKRCHSFTIEDYTALSLAISAYVYPYRRYQEAVKETIFAAQSEEELDEIQIDYGSVGATA
ncbi:hypothetical protein [Agathobaculum sp. Marseille-P7918]|uniref:hypothetical protein n=1 Tax=Agathobaculum sp. Marseille-P7918 TaxID=2479843 RepID=UPI003561A38C